MALLGNILWFIFFGWWNFLLYGFFGILCSITIIGIPIGKALFQYAKLMTLPFGKVIIKETELKGKENVSAIRRIGGVIANILWLPVGIITFILNIGTMIICAISIIGIPVAVVLAKSCKFLLWPVGAKVITKDEAEVLKMEKAMTKTIQNSAATSNTAVPNQGIQPQQNAQSGQRLENFRETGGKAVSAIAETGGKAVSVIAETGGRAVSAIAATSNAGVSALDNRQKMMKEKVLARQTDITAEDLLTQAEVKLYRNSVMAWIMPFLEYITLAIGVISAICGIIWMRGPRGLFYGITVAAPLMIIAALLGVIKRSRIFVIAVLGVQLVSHIPMILLARHGIIAADGSFVIKGVVFSNILWMVCYVGVIAAYVYLFIEKNSTGQKQGVASSAAYETAIKMQTASGESSLGVKKFCSQCSAEVSGEIDFCGNCGAKVEKREQNKGEE